MDYYWPTGDCERRRQGIRIYSSLFSSSFFSCFVTSKTTHSKLERTTRHIPLSRLFNWGNFFLMYLNAEWQEGGLSDMRSAQVVVPWYCAYHQNGICTHNVNNNGLMLVKSKVFLYLLWYPQMLHKNYNMYTKQCVHIILIPFMHLLYFLFRRFSFHLIIFYVMFGRCWHIHIWSLLTCPYLIAADMSILV